MYYFRFIYKTCSPLHIKSHSVQLYVAAGHGFLLLLPPHRHHYLIHPLFGPLYKFSIPVCDVWEEIMDQMFR